MTIDPAWFEARCAPGAAWAVALLVAALGACADLDTTLTSPVALGGSGPDPREPALPGAEQTPGEPPRWAPRATPPGPARASPTPPSEPVPAPPREPSAASPAPGPDACAPVAAPAPGARAALAPFEQRCGPGGLTPAGAQALVRAPYLQRATSSSVDILYKRRSGGASDSVDLSLPDGSVVARVPTLADPGAPGGLQRLARVEGLAPATYYCYAVAGLTERIGFRTAPEPAQGAVVRFAVFGDSGDGGVGQAAVRDRLLSLPVDLVLHTGDVAYDSGTVRQLDQYFFRVYQGLLGSVPLFPVPGNHEYYTDAAAPYLEVFALPENAGAAGRERWYSFDFGDVHFVGLDTEQLGSDQVQWLERDLSESQRRWTVVYFHRPPFSSGAHGDAPDVEQAFAPVLQRHSVPLVFAGHEHSYERTHPVGGVTYVITGGGGKLIRPVGAGAFTAKSLARLHLVGVEVRGASLHVSALDVAGVAFDSFELTAPD